MPQVSSARFGDKPTFQSNAVSSQAADFGGSSQEEFLRVEEAYTLSIDASPDSLTLHWDIEPGYYLYQERYKVKAFSVDGEVALDLAFDKAKEKYDEYFEKDMLVYYHESNISTPLPTGLNKIQLKITSQGCADAGLCYPPYTERYEVDLNTGDSSSIDSITFGKTSGAAGGSGLGGGSGVSNNQSTASLPSAAESTYFLPYILLMAVLGGLILNLMPCVFPVLSIKAMSFVSAHGNDHSHHVHGWVYTAGAVLSFMVIGGIIVAIRAAGGEADWGRQLQSPLFVSLMFYLFLVMGLSLSGFVHFGSSLMGVGQSLTARQGLQGSFFTGVLAVVVASPCTAPFMAPAMGVALTQSAPVALSIFAALGLGMALPFLLLSYSPKLASLLPQPGAWMETLKQALAFPLYLTAVWLLWVLGRQTSIDAAAVVISGAIALGFAIWLWQKRPQSLFGKSFKYTASTLAVAAAIMIAVKADKLFQHHFWEDYSPEFVAEMRSLGHPVFINLTAAWCITCHANERVALSRESVIAAADELDIVLVKGDYTNEDPKIHALLNQYQRPSVPLYLMYPADPNQPPEILPQLLTPSVVIEAMQRAAARQLASN
ncbi:protein-disulfide reductase DsbD family protein [Aurantivibrio plasticivorans]